MNGMACLARGGAWALMPLFVVAAAGWRFFHATAPPRVAEIAIVPVARGPLHRAEETPVALAMPVFRSEPAPEPSESRRKSRPGTDRWYREEARARLAADPEEFERTARERLRAAAPLAEKAALLKASLEGPPERADRLFALALDTGKTSDPLLREAAFNFLLRDVESSRDPAPAWERLRAFVAGPALPETADLRRRGAPVLAAAAPERRLDIVTALALQDPDLEFRRALAGGLARNPAPRARDFALLNGGDPAEGMEEAGRNYRED